MSDMTKVIALILGMIGVVLGVLAGVALGWPQPGLTYVGWGGVGIFACLCLALGYSSRGE